MCLINGVHVCTYRMTCVQYFSATCTYLRDSLGRRIIKLKQIISEVCLHMHCFGRWKVFKYTIVSSICNGSEIGSEVVYTWVALCRLPQDLLCKHWTSYVGTQPISMNFYTIEQGWATYGPQVIIVQPARPPEGKKYYGWILCVPLLFKVVGAARGNNCNSFSAHGAW